MKRVGPRFAHSTLPRCVAFVLLVSSAGASSGVMADADAPLLHAMFQDHAVLQRDAPIRVWGHAKAGDKVAVTLDGSSASGRADRNGTWQVLLPAHKAGGPYTLAATAASGAKQNADDVLVGDVWLCSGQSNMELQVHRTLDSRSEIQNATHETIRLLAVPQGGSVAPLETFSKPAAWEKSTPQTVRDFSAACYYFARELQKTIDVPMGLIESAWGGARIQAWISPAALRTTGEFGRELDVLAAYAKDRSAGAKRWGDVWQAWWRKRPGLPAGDAPWDAAHGGDGWRDAPPQLGGYQKWGVPDLADFIGMLWYRTTVKLTAQQAAQAATLAIGQVDEIDQTFVNGLGVGSSYVDTGSGYPLARGVLHAGDNLVAVSILNTYKDGGLIGPPEKQALHLADGSSVPLDGTWQYRKVPKEYGDPPRAPWETAGGISILYNGMIEPLGHYGLRGMLWYQGESNTGDPDGYRRFLRLLRSDWRARFGKDLPMLIVQLASYGAAPTRPGESNSARLRDAQREVAAEDAHSGLAITIDIGDRYDVHPANKQELGRRLARAASHVVYGEAALPPSGPVPRAAKRDGDSVVVAFGDVTNGLVAYGADSPVGFALCGSQADSCRYATGEIRGNDVVLRAANAATATRVRYGWADSPVVTLFDGAGLPAGPFELAISSPPTKGSAAQ
jgi:sialate O-acetylesterase